MNLRQLQRAPGGNALGDQFNRETGLNWNADATPEPLPPPELLLDWRAQRESNPCFRREGTYIRLCVVTDVTITI